jgi:hypothetical protein
MTLVMLSTVWAEDAVFHDSRLSRLDENKETKIDLTISDAGFTIQERKGSPFEIRYSSIQKISYEYARHHRLVGGAMLMAASPLAGIIVMATKTKSHWLVVDYVSGGASRSVVLRLDKSDYQKILSALESKSGIHVDSPGPKTVALDPTEGSRDIDGVLSASVERIAAALKPAMEMYGCKVTKDQSALIECKRGRDNSERAGIGGEVVTATLDAQGQQARIRIRTSGPAIRKRNWSTPIYDQMRSNLRLAAP